MIGDALVDVLVVAAEQRELLASCEAHGVRVRELLSARRQEDDRRLGAERLDRLEERRGLHHHARRRRRTEVVHRAVPVVRVVAQIHELYDTSPAAAARAGMLSAERRRRRNRGRS